MVFFVLFFFNDTATTEIYTLSLHDALPIWASSVRRTITLPRNRLLYTSRNSSDTARSTSSTCILDRKSTRLNSSHANISYAVFCLKKKRITRLIRSKYTDDYTIY